MKNAGGGRAIPYPAPDRDRRLHLALRPGRAFRIDDECGPLWPIGPRRYDHGFSTLVSDRPLSRAVDLTLAGFQQNFPVMDGERLLGVLTHDNVLKGPAERGKNSAAQEAMRRDFDTTKPSEPLDGASTRMRQGERRLLMVDDNEKVVGLLTVGNTRELPALEAAGQKIGESAVLSPAVGPQGGAETSPSAE